MTTSCQSAVLVAARNSNSERASSAGGQTEIRETFHTQLSSCLSRVDMSIRVLGGHGHWPLDVKLAFAGSGSSFQLNIVLQAGSQPQQPLRRASITDSCFHVQSGKVETIAVFGATHGLN